MTCLLCLFNMICCGFAENQVYGINTGFLTMKLATLDTKYKMLCLKTISCYILELSQAS